MTLETRASLAVAVGRRKFRNEAVVEKPEGSLTAITLYSLVAGLVRVKRVRARASVVGPKSTRREISVERLPSGRAPSSWGRNSGARPSLWTKSVVAPSGVKDQP